jgi:glycosyltransferase involved in cell wall biosynthesis
VSPLRISLITPSFNQGRFIGRTIESVLGQRGDFQLDYRVIDGGSTDQTRSILAGYGPHLSWVSEPDQGQVDAINKGLRAARGEVVGWLNSDDLLLEGALARVARAFREHPGAEWVHGRCLVVDEQDRPMRDFVGRYKDFRARRHSFENLLTENYINQMTAFWRRSVHDQVGYLDSGPGSGIRLRFLPAPGPPGSPGVPGHSRWPASAGMRAARAARATNVSWIRPPASPPATAAAPGWPPAGPPSAG